MRADIRLDDLRRREQVASKLMNVKIPAEVSDRIQKVATALKASKTEVVIALLNEGLNVANLAKVRLPRAKAKSAGGKTCSISGCENVHVAKGYCANHYQAWRRGRLAT